MIRLCSWVVMGMLLLSGPSVAQVLRVTSGEHAGFTRIVVMGSGLDPWRFGRTAEGYGLILAAGAPRFDLTGAFRLIGRDRVAAIWADPITGQLNLRVGCVCHAAAVPDRPGVLVVDVRDGPAPEGSPFEIALDAGAVRPLTPGARSRPKPRPAGLALQGPDWVAAVLSAARLDPAARLAALSGDAPVRAEDLRAMLAGELSRGAARGLVEFAGPASDRAADADLPGNLRSYDASFPGLVTLLGDESGASLDAEGAACLPDAELDLAAWGDARPVWQQMAEATDGLAGEFDRPDPAARDRAVRFLLYAGFGVEARQILDSFGGPPDLAQRDAVLRAVAAIIDDETVAAPELAPMAGCDGTVALWALLALGESRDVPVNADAVRRGLSALPPHLRREVGPRVVASLLARGEAAAAEDVQAAIERPGATLSARVATSAAELALKGGDPAAALSELDRAREAGLDPAAMALEVETRVGMGLPVAPGTAQSIEALLAERPGAADSGDLARALALARAASGDVPGGFAVVPRTDETTADLWSVLARTGDDDTLLTLAVGADPLQAGAKTRLRIAERLVGLGLGAAALDWLSGAEGDSLLAARAALLQGDARAALRLSAGLQDPEADPLRRTAIGQLYDPGSDMLPLPGPVDAQVAAWTGDWSWLARNGTDAWAQAARLVDAAPAAVGPIAQGHAVLEASVETRDALDALLSATP